MSDKIAAIATGHARTGIGVLRLSGDGCIEAAEQVFRLNSGRPLSSLSDRKLALGTLFDAQGRPIDHCMAFLHRRGYRRNSVPRLPRSTDRRA